MSTGLPTPSSACGPWDELLAARRIGRRSRLIVTPFLAAGVLWLTGQWWLLLWAVLIFAVMAVDARLYIRLVRTLQQGARPDTAGQVLWTALQAGLWVAPAWALWKAPPFGDSICFVLLASACMQSAVSLRAAPRLVVAACMPLLLGMAAAPIALGFNGGSSFEGLVATEFSVFLLGVFTFGLFAALCRADRAREAALEAARRAHQEAEAADRAKSDFLLLLGEELRTPAAALAAAGRELGDNLTPTARVQLGAVLDASEVLGGVLEDVLATAQMAPGLTPFGRVRRTDLRLITRYAVEAWRARAKEKWLELVLDIDGRVPEEVMIDPSRLKQGLFALLAYALEGVRSGGVRVSLRLDGFRGDWADLRIVLTDNDPPETTNLRTQAWALASRAATALHGVLRRECEEGELVGVTLAFQARLTDAQVETPGSTQTPECALPA